MVFRRRGDSAAEVIGRIAGNQSFLYGVTHDDCRALLYPCSRFQTALFLRYPQRDQQVGGFQVGDKDIADERENVQFQ